MLVLLICLSLVFSYKGFFHEFMRSTYHRPLVYLNLTCVLIKRQQIMYKYNFIKVTCSLRSPHHYILDEKSHSYNCSEERTSQRPIGRQNMRDDSTLPHIDGWEEEENCWSTVHFHKKKIPSFICGNFFLNSLRVNGGHRFWVNLDVINQSRYLIKESVHIDMRTMKTCFVWQAQNIFCFQKLKMLLLLHFKCLSYIFLKSWIIHRENQGNQYPEWGLHILS